MFVRIRNSFLSNVTTRLYKEDIDEIRFNCKSWYIGKRNS